MALRGIFTPADIIAEQPKDLSAFVQSAYVNEYMLAMRLSRVPAPTESFDIYTHGPRPRVLALGANIAADDTATITLDNVSALLVGDVLEIGAERVAVSGNPTVTNATTGAGTVPVTRGVEGTTPANSTSSAATHSDGDTVRLIGNSRTGAEVDQQGYRVKRKLRSQYVQTYQFPVQVGGRAAASADLGGVVLPSGPAGARTPGGGPMLAREEEDKLTDLLLDVEETSFYGIGQDGTTAPDGRWRQTGLKQFAQDVSNYVGSPTNAAAYKPTDLSRDIIQGITNKKGRIDTLICSTDFDIAFATWHNAAQALPAGETEYGQQILVYRSALFPRLGIWFSQALRPGSVIGIDSQRIRMRVKRPESYAIRGRRGDAYEGDWLFDGAIDMEDPDQGLIMVENITGFAPPTGMS